MINNNKLDRFICPIYDCKKEFNINVVENLFNGDTATLDKLRIIGLNLKVA